MDALNDKFDDEELLSYLIRKKVIPDYFLSIPDLINELIISDEKPNEIIENSFLVSGGTDIYVQKQEEIYSGPILFIDSNDKEENICIIDNKCFIKSTTTVNQIVNSEIINTFIPEIKKYLSLFGSNQIRNRATVGGNIVNASPIADLTSILLALNCDIHLSGDNAERIIPLKNFFISHKNLIYLKMKLLKKLVLIYCIKVFYLTMKKFQNLNISI